MNESEKEQRRREKEFADDIAWLVDISKRGRRIMWNILVQCGVFSRTLDTNALVMASNEGKRSVGNSLMGIICQKRPKRFVEMIEEQNNGVNTNE